jgi:protein TonB
MNKSIAIILACLLGFLSAFAQDSKSEPEEEVFTIVEDMPLYPGGDKALLAFVGSTVEYPPKAKAANITGVVYVSYIVNKKGKATKVRVVRGAHPLLDKAGVKCIKKLKGYKPGMQDGKPVRVQFTIPIRFVLN